jgi:hypothetical protein
MVAAMEERRDHVSAPGTHGYPSGTHGYRPGEEADAKSERTAQAPSHIDAMGLDKRRQVRGKTYGPTRLRIFMRFAIFFVVLALLVVGVMIAVDELDKPPETSADEAPWAEPGAPQREPRPIQ